MQSVEQVLDRSGGFPLVWKPTISQLADSHELRLLVDGLRHAGQVLLNGLDHGSRHCFA